MVADIAREPMVIHVLERAAIIGPPVILATSTDRDDDTLARLVGERGWPVFRGSRDDVLSRIHDAVPVGTHVVVRITADCPLFDPAVGREVLHRVMASEADYASNVMPPTYPDGLDCEALTARALDRVWSEATLPSDREHVTTYIRNRPADFRIVNVAHDPDLSSERWTVDDERDLAFIRAVYARLPTTGAEAMSMTTVLGILERSPELRELNAGTARNEGYRRSLARDQSSPADRRVTRE